MSLLFIFASISQIIVELRCSIHSAFEVVSLLSSSLLRFVPLVHRSHTKSLFKYRNLHRHLLSIGVSSRRIECSLSAGAFTSLGW